MSYEPATLFAGLALLAFLMGIKNRVSADLTANTRFIDVMCSVQFSTAAFYLMDMFNASYAFFLPFH